MLIPILLTSLTSNTRAMVPPFASITISPFYTSGESTIVVDTKSSKLNFYVFIQNDLYMNRCIVSDSITKAGTYTYKYDNSSTRSKNTVFIRYYTSKPTEAVDSEHFSRDIAKSSYELIEDNQSIESHNDLVVVRGNGTYSTRKIKYSFFGFDGLYVPSYYHKISVADFGITMTNTDVPFFKCEPSLVIKNYNHIFDDVEGANDTVTFPLKTKGFKTGHSFLLKNDLYVNPETLMLSSTQKEGYVKTKYIYLPINDMQNQGKYECYFAFTNFGIDRDMLIHSFELKALRNTFGDCSNSKYCIIRENI